MPKYIFLDTWVYALLVNPDSSRRITSFIYEQDYTVLITSVSLVELFNPQWEIAGNKDRMKAATEFLGKVPCVIVHPPRIYEQELANNLCRLPEPPVELDLKALPESVRAKTLLRFLRRDDIFLKQGLDIQRWSDGYRQTKADWLKDVDAIIEHACDIRSLKRNERGQFVELPDYKEKFLFSLDFRHSDTVDVNAVLASLAERAQAGHPAQLTAVRLSSICFWYAYIDVDKANRIKRQGSDIGDFFNISLMPYCAAFTTDGSMHRMLRRVRERTLPMNCIVMTRQRLEQQLKHLSGN